LFEVEVSGIEPFRNLIKALDAVVEEGCFDIDEAHIRLRAMDPSHVAMVDFDLPGEFFDKYLCEGESKIFINIGEFLKFLDRVERDELAKIRLDEERARLVIQCIRPGHTRRFEMAILEPLDEEVPQPKILFKSSARILTQSLRQAIDDPTTITLEVLNPVDLGSELKDYLAKRKRLEDNRAAKEKRKADRAKVAKKKAKAKTDAKKAVAEKVAEIEAKIEEPEGTADGEEEATSEDSV